ncbi:MAG: zinc-binding dehydrogenase [Alphaproteobacteria bacterium]|nr:zinc-binding dehydrogenase [Alphaproteobacteria bacterium]
MKAALYREFGAPDVLGYEDVDDPTAGPGEIVVEVHAVTVNRVLDCAVRAGEQTQRGVVLPHIGGVDPAGIVREVGEGVSNVAAGDRVALLSRAPCLDCDICAAGDFKKCSASTMLGVGRWGGAAELVKVPASVAVKLPENLEFAEAAAVLRHGPMAHHLLFDVGDLQEGQSVLVMGAAGGLGLTGIQIAKAAGATVIAAAGADERVAVACDYGADFGVNYAKQDLTEAVRGYMGGEGIDLVFENVSNPKTWPKALKCLRKLGTLVTAGAHGGGKVELDCAFLYHQNIRIFGSTGNTDKNVSDTVSLAGEGKLKAKIEKVFPLSDAPAAHRMMEGDVLSGKIVLDPTAG